MRAHRRCVELFRVAQNSLLRLKLNVFILRSQRSLIDLLALKPPKVCHSQPILLRRLQLVQLVRRGPPRSKRLGNDLCVQPAETVQQIPLLRLVERTQRLALRMDQRELRRKLSKHPHRRRLIVDEDSSLAVRDNLPPQQDIVRLASRFRLPRESQPRPASAQRRIPRQPCPLHGEPHRGDALPPSSSASASIRIDFPAPVSPVNRFKPKPKRSHRMVDHRIVFRAQLQQHRGLRLGRIARIANLIGILSGTSLNIESQHQN